MSEEVAVRSRTAITFIVAVVAVSSVIQMNTISAEQSRTQWDGIYTKAQAKRGEPLYSEQCAGCHGPDLTGGEMTPALTGGEFNSNWSGLPLGELFERIRNTMPEDKPGTLSRQQTVDILVYMLSKANYPAGTTELPQQTEVLNEITFTPLKP